MDCRVSEFRHFRGKTDHKIHVCNFQANNSSGFSRTKHWRIRNVSLESQRLEGSAVYAVALITLQSNAGWGSPDAYAEQGGPEVSAALCTSEWHFYCLAV